MPMSPRITRRAVFALPVSLSMSRHQDEQVSARARLADLEATSGGRLGVAVIDTGTGGRLGHRAGERFPLCSTFKVLAVALVLSRVDRGAEDLTRRIVFSEADLVPYSPMTEQHVGGKGMTLAELCAAAMTRSDNTAGNLLLASFGGPPALTAYVRGLGDRVTRIDRTEPELNEAAPGDPRDTTTPATMLENLRTIVLGDALAASSRKQMTAWLLANQTGDSRLRAGTPAGWEIGDKTGSSLNGVANDIAVLWPPARPPLVIAAYLAESPAAMDEREAVLAEVARIVVMWS